jgi:hypothetical protein
MVASYFLLGVFRSVFSFRRGPEPISVALVSTALRASLLLLVFVAVSRFSRDEAAVLHVVRKSVHLEQPLASKTKPPVSASVSFDLLRFQHESFQPFVNSCALLRPFSEVWDLLNWSLFEREHRETGFMSWFAVGCSLFFSFF